MQNIKKTYEGFTNRETWLVSLWISNDQCLQAIFIEAIYRKGSKSERANWLESKMHDAMCTLDIDPSLWYDLMAGSLIHVNWLEIIEHN